MRKNIMVDRGENAANVVFAYGAINDPCVFAIFADWRQVALEIEA